MRRHHRQGAKATSAAPLLYLLLIVLIAFTLLVATIILQSREKSGGLYDKLGKFVMAAAAAGKASLKGGELTSAVSEKHIKRDAEASSTVFFDWPHSSDFFGYANYKALESHLTHFDKMSTKGVQMGSRAFSVYTFKVLHLGPQLSQYYKYGDMLSKTTFMKYAKRGYPIEVWIQGMGTGLLMESREAPRNPPLPASNRSDIDAWAGSDLRSYYHSNLMKSLNVKNMNSIRRQQESSVPRHLLFYSRLYNLYLFGGYYIDLAFYSAGGSNSLREAINGYAVTTYCYTFPEQQQQQQHGCSSSMLMKFPAGSPVLLCTLAAFDEDHFSYHSATNTFEENAETSKGSRSFLPCLLSDLRYGGIKCLNRRMAHCFNSTGTRNELDLANQGYVDSYKTHSIIPSASIEGLMVVDHFTYPKLLHNSVVIADASNAFDAVYQNSSSDITGLIWLGPRAHFASWSRPDNGSPLQRAIDSAANRLRRQHTFASCASPSSASSTRRQCPHYSVTSIPFEHAPLNLSSRPTTAQLLLQAGHSCSLTFVVAGFMKAGSSYLYSLLTNHPQVVKPLRGVQFKESGCYLRDSMVPRKALSRLSCFPFVEGGDGVVYGDGTVYYSMRREVPGVLLRDNPDVKAIFIVRDPVERTASHHRYSFKAFALMGLADINAIVAVALNGSEPRGLCRLHDLAAAAVAARDVGKRALLLAQLEDAFFDGVRADFDPKRYRSCANIILHSLYYPAVRHWMNELGEDKVRVVSAEQLYPPWRNGSSGSGSAGGGVYAAGDTALREAARARLSSLMSDLHGFLGVCPKKRYLLQDSDLHETHTYGRLLRQDTLSAESEKRLRDFYRPFNKLLEELPGVTLGYG